MLLSEYVMRQLYDSEAGYFVRNSQAVGALEEPIDFRRLWGRMGYLRLLSKLYASKGCSWLTPVEVFQPWYAQAIAECILQRHLGVGGEGPQAWAEDATCGSPLLIYEIGGGGGTCAANILDFLKQAVPLIYSQTQYVSVEISSQLSQRQLAHVAGADPGHVAEGRYAVENRDALERHGWGAPDDRPCYVIMLEVMDNLPHDRFVRSTEDGSWGITWVGATDDDVSSTQWEEALAAEPTGPPVAGHQCPHRLAQECHRLFVDFRASLPGERHRRRRSSDTLFLPTACLKFLKVLHEARPNHTLVAADFDELPEVTIPGYLAPLVASKLDGQTEDHESYFVPRGSADIFFPTDFQFLQYMHSHVRDGARAPQPRRGPAHPEPVPQHSGVLRTADFMNRYARIERTRTRFGYNPLVQDYSNTSVFVS